MRLDFFEGLVAFLPILLFAVLTIFLRSRSSARRRLQQDQEKGSAPPDRSLRPLPSHEYPKPLSAEKLRAAGGPEAGETPSSRDFAEAELYPFTYARAESFRPPEPAARKAGGLGGPERVFPPVQEGGRRPRSRGEGLSTAAAPPSSRTPQASITQRLSSLPPLKRAVVWAEILGPPASRSEPRQ